MATGLVLSIWRTFRYSRMASRYCSLLKYLSPRSRWRAFLASGDREHPATTRSAVNETTNHVGVILNITVVSPVSIGQVLSEHRVQGLDVSDEMVGGVRYAAGDRSRDSHQRPIRPVSKDPVLHHLDLRGHLARDRLTLGVIPVEDELL